jgi:aminopeptidase N
MMLRRPRAWFCLLVFLAERPLADEPAPAPRRSEKFTAPLRDPPSRDFDFTHLKLECAFDWKEEAVEGSVTHAMKAFRDGVRSVEVDAIGIDVRSVTARDGRTLSFETLPEKLRIDLGKESRAGEEVELTIAYRARPEMGLYFRSPEKGQPDTPRQVWTQGEPEEARHWIPCFDHPADKLTTEVLVAAPEGMTVISNGRLLGVAPGKDGRVFHWLQDQPHASYLISVIVGDFAVWKDSTARVPLTAYVDRRYEAHAARSFGQTADMMRFFEARTGTPYPWAKYDQTCVNGFFFGGMENTSATTLHEHTLHDERGALDISSLELVAHELAHQWFGDLVTCKDWGDLWLNESFATFFENLYKEHHLGWDEGVYGRHEQGVAYKQEDRDEYRRSLSTRSWRRSTDLFDEHTYPKGGRILSMLRHVLGDAPFFAGIKLYLDRHAFRSVETADFRTAMEDATGTSLGWFFDQWVHRGGHPRYRVSWSWDSRGNAATVEVEQTQAVDDLTPLFRMPVVLAFFTPSGRVEHRVWVAEKQHSFTFPLAERPRLVSFDPGDWILKDLVCERSREESLHQLENDPCLVGRMQAAEALAKHLKAPEVEAALLGRLEKEPFWGVRLEIVRVIARARDDALSRKLLPRLAAEDKSTVRQEVARALGDLRGEEVMRALREAIEKDRSYFVAADALRALGKIARGGARPDALLALDRESYQEVIRAAAIEVLVADDAVAGDEKRGIVDKLLGLAGKAQPFPVRGAAFKALARIGKGEARVREALLAGLDDHSLHVRLEAVEALAVLGDREAVPALVARQAKEKPAIFRDPAAAIRRAIERLEARTDVNQLQEDVRRLRASNEELENRIRVLERRGQATSF